MNEPSGPTAPPTDPLGVEPPALPFDAGQWLARLNAAKEKAKQRVVAARLFVERYMVRPLPQAPTTDTVTVPHDFFYTEQKKAQLFYAVPEFHLAGANPNDELTAPLFAAVLNQRILSARGVNAQVLMDALVMDILTPFGFGACKVGYTSTTRDMPVPDPMTGQPAIDPMTMLPVMQPVVISHRYFADHIPGGRLRLPIEWLGGDIDDASWVGFDYIEYAKDHKGGGTMQEYEDLVQPAIEQQQSIRVEQRRRVTEVWYRASLFDDEAHPDQIRMFEWAEGESAPRRHENSPYQVTLPNGKLGGMKGYPIGYLTVRTLPDSPVPPSDSAIAKKTVDELSMGRTQLLQRRDRALPQTVYDTQRVGPQAIDQIEKNINSAFIGVNGNPSEMFLPLDKGAMNRETYIVQDYLERDMERIYALGSNQTGTPQKGARTATELQIIQSNSDTRLDYERERIVAWLCEKFVPKVASLVQQFADETEYVQVLGPNGAMQLQAWNKENIQGEFVYSVQAGATQRHDVNAQLKRWLDAYNLTANDPNANRTELLRNIFRTLGMDPQRTMQTPPPSPPPQPKVSASVKMEDLLTPAAPIALKLLMGQPITQQDADEMTAFNQGSGFAAWSQNPANQPPTNGAHGGPAKKVEPLDKHTLDLTGQLPGGGSIAAQGRPQ